MICCIGSTVFTEELVSVISIMRSNSTIGNRMRMSSFRGLNIRVAVVILILHLCEIWWLFINVGIIYSVSIFYLLVIWLGLLLVFPFNILYDLFDLIHFLVKHFLVSIKRFEASLWTSVEIELSLLSWLNQVSCLVSVTTVHAHMGFLGLSSVSLARFVARVITLESL